MGRENKAAAILWRNIDSDWHGNYVYILSILKNMIEKIRVA